MITQTAEYALRAMVCLAEAGDEPQTTHSIAEKSRAPFGYLVKIMSSLCRQGLVVGRRGRHGGFVLARPASAISMYEVMLAASPTPSRKDTVPSPEDTSVLAHHLHLGCQRGRDHWNAIPLSRLVARKARRSAGLRPITGV